MDTAWQLLKATYRITAQRPKYMSDDTVLYTLTDQDDNKLSTIRGQKDKYDGEEYITDISGKTPEKHRRQGNYGKLMNAILQQNVGIISDLRNKKSHPFHEKFMSNVPENVKVTYPKDRVFDIITPIEYSKKNHSARFPNSDLSIRDYGSIPIERIPDEPDTFERPYGKGNNMRLTEFDPAMFPHSPPLDTVNNMTFDGVNITSPLSENADAFARDEYRNSQLWREERQKYEDERGLGGLYPVRHYQTTLDNFTQR